MATNPDLDPLAAQVAKNTDVDASAVALLNGLSAIIAKNANDPAALQALAASLKASADSLADAVVQNTPAA